MMQRNGERCPDRAEAQGVCGFHRPGMCGYSNCFRRFDRMRGFMPVCATHAENPDKFANPHFFRYVGRETAKNLAEVRP